MSFLNMQLTKNMLSLDKINKEYINLIIFDDLVFSNKKYLSFIAEVEN